MQPKSHYRLAAENSEMMHRLIDCAEKIIQEEGISSLTVGRLAREFDLKRPTIHYYIGTIEDLIVNIIRAGSARIEGSITKALQTSDPLTVIWNLGSNTSLMSVELSALAMRSPNISAEVGKYIEHFSGIFTDILENHLRSLGISPSMPPPIIVAIIQSLAQGLSLKKSLGVSQAMVEIETASKEIINALCGLSSR